MCYLWPFWCIVAGERCDSTQPCPQHLEFSRTVLKWNNYHLFLLKYFDRLNTHSRVPRLECVGREEAKQVGAGTFCSFHSCVPC